MVTLKLGNISGNTLSDKGYEMFHSIKWLNI